MNVKQFAHEYSIPVLVGLKSARQLPGYEKFRKNDYKEKDLVKSALKKYADRRKELIAQVEDVTATYDWIMEHYQDRKENGNNED